MNIHVLRTVLLRALLNTKVITIHEYYELIQA